MIDIGRRRKKRRFSDQDDPCCYSELHRDAAERDNGKQDGSSITSSMVWSSTALAHLNTLMEQAWFQKCSSTQNASSVVDNIGPGFLPESAWDQWLWHEDPLEEAPAAIQLNRMHLLGLLIARWVYFIS